MDNLNVTTTYEVARGLLARVGKMTLNLIVDSGAECSLMASETYDKINKKYVKNFVSNTTDRKVRSVSGGTLIIKGDADVQIKIGKERIWTRFTLIENMPRPYSLLGMNFLTDTGARIDFRSRTLAVGQSVVLLKSKDDIKAGDPTVLLTTSHRYVIPPTLLE